MSELLDMSSLRGSGQSTSPTSLCPSRDQMFCSICDKPCEAVCRAKTEEATQTGSDELKWHLNLAREECVYYKSCIIVLY